MVRFVCFAAAVCAALAVLGAAPDYRSWSVVAGGPEGMRYSALDQINRTNVNRLELAWKFESGDEFPGSEMQCNPIVVGGVLYATTPKLRVVALDAATGAQKWAFDPFAGEKVATKMRNRGVVYWSGGREERIFVAARQYLYALDARTGRPAPGFGEDGRIDLRKGLGREPETLIGNFDNAGRDL
jgi:quinoprotein glucose dehydrogenase